MEKVLIDGIEVEVHRNYYTTGELNQEWLQTVYDLHGYHKTFYKNGQLKEYKEYRKNEWIGIDERYYENGAIQQKVVKVKDSLFLNEAWYENGNRKHQFYQNHKGEGLGDQTKWYENGNTELIIKYTDPAYTNGDYTSYYENGDLCLTGKYENTVFKVLDFYNLKREQTLHQGNGFTEIFENGILKYFTNYKNGMRNGISKIFAHDGTLRCEGFYIDGKENGKSIWYKPTGEIEEIIYMENGVMTHREEK